MSIVTPGIVPASELLAEPPPAWLDECARFAEKLAYDDLPEEVVARAKLVLLDSIGAIAAGAREPEVRALVRRFLADGRAGPAPAIGTGIGLDPASAALANGVAGTMLELDEGNQYARGHPAIHVVPALLALRPADGRALLVALVVGYEIGARIGIASRLRVTMHPHGTWGTVGAALAVAKLKGSDAGRLAAVVNASSSLGLATSRRTMLEGATVRNAYAGLSNQLGLLACDLVDAGFSGERDGIGTVYGSVIADDFSPEAMTEALGVRYEIARNYFKRHAACRYTHGALDALAAIVREAGGIAAEDVAGIGVDTYSWAAQLDHPEPTTMLGAKFSLPFAMATTLVHGGATVEAFRGPALADARVRDLARRVTVREDAALTARLPGLRPARVAVNLRDGRVLRHEVLTNRGDTEDPYGPDEVRAKFLELASPVWGEAACGRIAAAVEALDTAALEPLLAAAPLEDS